MARGKTGQAPNSNSDIANGSVTFAKQALSARAPQYNLMTNPHLCENLNGTPYDIASAEDQYGADGWKFATENDSVRYSKTTSGAPIDADCSMRATKLTNTGKVMFYQFLDTQTGFQSNQWGSTGVQVQVRASKSLTLRGAYVTNDNSNDNAPDNPLVDVWGGDGTDPTLNNATLSDEIDLGVTTSWQTAIFGDGALGLTNKGVAFFTDEQVEAGDWIEIATPLWVNDPTTRQVQMPTLGEALAQVAQFGEKSYANDNSPGDATTTGQLRVIVPSGDTLLHPIRFRQKMVKTPTIEIYSPDDGAGGSGGSARLYNATAGSNETPSVTDISQTGFVLEHSAGVAGEELNFHYVARAGI